MISITKIYYSHIKENQIKIVGLGVLIASIIMLIFTIAYVINPDVLNLILQYQGNTVKIVKIQ